MPAGCDFICKNDECEHTGKGFVMTGPWPMANIDAVIQSDRVSQLPDQQEKLKEQKVSGREYACITFPNIDEIPTEKYRVQYWNEENQCIWQYEFEESDRCKLSELGKEIHFLLIQDECPLSGELVTFKNVTKDGIDCPACNERMYQNRWFTQEN